MKICLLILLLFVCNCAFSQLNDNFNDGNFTVNPAWKGDDSAFSVNGSYSLQTNKTAESRTISLSTESQLSSAASWEFYIRLNFDPSASNRLRVYLVSDQENLEGPLKGYFIQIGETGDTDSYDLYRQNGTSITRIIDGPEQSRLNTDQLVSRLKITRDNNGFWEINSDNSGGNNFTASGSATDATYMQSAWFGLVCQYTSTRSDQFYLDDFVIQPWQDNTTPGDDEIAPGNILISEVLFNPRDGGVDFVELYNNSGKTLDLQDLFIGNVPLPDTLNRAKRISTVRFSLQPGAYLALTSDPDKVKSEYYSPDPASFLRMSSFPAYNNDQGTITIQSKGQLIDEFAYTEKMHSAIIKDPEGISLERTNFKRPAREPGNFKSAAAAAGFATPGYKNSRSISDEEDEELFNLSSATFSPDSDGFEDLLQINYKLKKSDYIANITIYNSYGFTVRKLYKNYTLGSSGILEWDGRDESSEIRPAGIYLLLAELFTTDGEVRKIRKTIVLAQKF